MLILAGTADTAEVTPVGTTLTDNHRITLVHEGGLHLCKLTLHVRFLTPCRIVGGVVV